MSSASSISVTVRVRPFSIREAAQLTRVDDAPTFFGDGSLAGTPKPTLAGKGVRRVVKVMDEQMLIFDPAEESPVARYQKTILPQGKRVKDMRFGFDRVFDETCSQQDVYESTTKPLLDSVLDGFNATVFAYGATGCGKTHTISGTPQHPGIIFLTCAELFVRIADLADEKEVTLSLSYLEIYNETIRDLLVPGGSRLGLQLREDTHSNIAVAGLSTHSPRTVEEVMDMIVMGNANRTMSPTEANATSSRSHAVLQINVSQKPKTAGIQENHFAATLSIIDLAGSERASVTKNRGERLLEGANINRSLLALGNCINALCDPTRKNHIPYRDSKLTRLLKFSLGGNCKTVMIVCVSPSSQHYDETHNTLKYANRAKNIKTKVSRNIINVNRHVSQYVQAIYDLRQEVDSLKGRLNNSTKEAMDKIHKSNACKEASIQDGLKRLKASYEQTKEIRREKISNWQNLRIVGNRIALVKAWLSAFDEVAADLGHEEPPETLFKLRAEAEKVLRTLENNQLAIHQQDASLNWEKALELTLQNSLRSLQGIEGVQQNDATLLTSEANLLRMTGARDIYHAIADEDVDFSASINSLSKAHFQAYSVIHKIMDSSMSEPDALEAARKSLFDVMKNTGDAVALIINPTGKFLSNDIYQPGSFSSPKKKKSIGSPFRAPQGFSGIASPIKPSPRYIKAKSPKKAVKFPKKEKKRVRFQDELGDTTICEDSKRTRVVTDGMFPTIPARDDSFLHPKNDPNLGPNNHSPSTGMAVPPTRPKSRFDAGFLSKPKQPSPDPSSDVSLPTASNSPLRSFDGFDQLINRLGSQDSNDTTINESSWRALRQPGRGTMRKSIAGTGPIRPIPKRRSPSGSSQNSPEGVGQWKLGHSKRMPKGE